MRYLFSILAFTTLLFSTQPVWQSACQQVAASCGSGICEAQTETCTSPTGTPSDDAPDRQCCPPFQCCFLSFPGFSTPYALELREFFEKKTPPQATIAEPRSQYLSDCFHPPELADCQ